MPLLPSEDEYNDEGNYGDAQGDYSGAPPLQGY
jgi:hypothetical protein